MNLSQLWEIADDRGDVCYSLGVTKNKTRLSDCITTKWTSRVEKFL